MYVPYISTEIKSRSCRTVLEAHIIKRRVWYEFDKLVDVTCHLTALNNNRHQCMLREDITVPASMSFVNFKAQIY